MNSHDMQKCMSSIAYPLKFGENLENSILTCDQTTCEQHLTVEPDLTSALASTVGGMSPVSPVFHTVVTVSIVQPWWLGGRVSASQCHSATVDQIPSKYQLRTDLGTLVVLSVSRFRNMNTGLIQCLVCQWLKSEWSLIHMAFEYWTKISLVFRPPFENCTVFEWWS